MKRGRKKKEISPYIDKIRINIKETREKKGIKQKDVAKSASLSIAAYSNIENGRSKDITIEVGIGIAKALGMPFAELFEIKDVSINNPELIQKISELEKLKHEVIDLKDKINELQKRIEDKDLVIEMFKNEKARLRKDVIRFLEEMHDQQTYYLKSLSDSIGLNKFQQKEIKERIISMFNTIASSYFLTTGLIKESDFDKITGKYTGIVRPGDPEKNDE